MVALEIRIAVVRLFLSHSTLGSGRCHQSQFMRHALKASWNTSAKVSDSECGLVGREEVGREEPNFRRIWAKTMSTSRAVLLRRGFILGYAAALRRARKDLDRLAANFDAEIASLQDEARKELHSLTASFSAEIDAVAREVHREKTNRAVKEAANERATIPDGWLH